MPLPKHGANLFFQLVSVRYEKGAMIFATNRALGEWAKVVGEPVVATALLDRLLHHAIVIEIEGASYRLRAHADLIDSVATHHKGSAADKIRRADEPKNYQRWW